MVQLATLLLTLAAGALSGPVDFFHKPSPRSLVERQSGSIANGEGTNNGYFYSVYAEPSVTGSYTNGPEGEYTLQWGGTGDVVVGKGWNPGRVMNITYSGVWAPEANGNSYLAVYGWTTNPLVEYYIVDAYGEYYPGTSGTYHGRIQSDGGYYDIYNNTRVNQPSIEGTATFAQYWSIRTSDRIGGTVTMQNHVDAWASYGFPLGTFNYLILATEAYSSSGMSSITVSNCSGMLAHDEIKRMMGLPGRL